MEPDKPNTNRRNNQPRKKVAGPAAGMEVTESFIASICDALNGRRGSSNPPSQRTR